MAQVQKQDVLVSFTKDETASSFCRKQAQEFVERAAAALGLHLEAVK